MCMVLISVCYLHTGQTEFNALTQLKFSTRSSDDMHLLCQLVFMALISFIFVGGCRGCAQGRHFLPILLPLSEFLPVPQCVARRMRHYAVLPTRTGFLRLFKQERSFVFIRRGLIGEAPEPASAHLSGTKSVPEPDMMQIDCSQAPGNELNEPTQLALSKAAATADRAQDAGQPSRKRARTGPKKAAPGNPLRSTRRPPDLPSERENRERLAPCVEVVRQKVTFDLYVTIEFHHTRPWQLVVCMYLRMHFGAGAARAAARLRV
jgi:hypothetical protein